MLLLIPSACTGTHILTRTDFWFLTLRRFLEPAGMYVSSSWEQRWITDIQHRLTVVPKRVYSQYPAVYVQFLGLHESRATMLFTDTLYHIIYTPPSPGIYGELRGTPHATGNRLRERRAQRVEFEVSVCSCGSHTNTHTKKTHTYTSDAGGPVGRWAGGRHC